MGWLEGRPLFPPAEVGGKGPARPAEGEEDPAVLASRDPRRPGEAGGGCAILKKMMTTKMFICIVLTLFIISTIVVVVWQSVKTPPGPSPSSPLSPPPSPSCPSGWPEFKEKCFFISEAEGGWDRGRHNCTSFNATLATIETQEEEDFLKSKNCTDHWIGLRRENDTQPWRRPNGLVFISSWLSVGGTGGCALWNGVNFTSTRCRAKRHWICSKPRSTA